MELKSLILLLSWMGLIYFLRNVQKEMGELKNKRCKS